MKNFSLLHSLGKAILIWLCTNAFGTLVVNILEPSLNPDDILVGITITLAYSFPTIILMMPIEFGLTKIHSRLSRLVYSVSMIFLLCLSVIMMFRLVLQFPLKELFGMSTLIIPYFATAQLSFLLVNRTAFR